MNNTLFIPQSKLDTLQECVCRPIHYLTTKVDSSTPLWDGPFKMCQQIEADVFAVNSVVNASREIKGKFSDNATYLYQAVLCRVYIILYYRHHDDDLYKEIVFHTLENNMGLYKNKLSIINEQINKILNQEQLLKKVQEEKSKDIKPVFEYVDHSRNEMDHLFIKYCGEQLFCTMSDVIKYLSKKYGTYLDEANVWFNAKRVVHTLRSVNHPELLIVRAAIALVAGQINKGYEGSQIILLCAYAMIRASEHNDHFNLFVKKMESLSDVEEDNNLTVIKNSINDIKHLIDEQTFDGYDYIGEQASNDGTFTSSDIDRIRRQIIEQERSERKKLLKKIEELQKELQEKDILINEAKKLETELTQEEFAKVIAEKDKLIDELTARVEELGKEMLDNKEIKDDTFSNKVRLALLLCLIMKDGANIEKHGNRTLAAEVMHKITGISIPTCKNYCTNQDLSFAHHKEEILQLNSTMQTLGMETRLY